MAFKALGRNLQASCVSIFFQLLCSCALIATALWLASLVLEPLNLVGITTVPPGIMYVSYADPNER